METKIYLKENWLKNDELVDVIGGKELLNAHKHLLECMSKITNSKSSEVIVNRSSPKVKKYRTNPELQDYYPAIFVPQDNFISRMREWGMIDQKVNKPIANKYIFKYHDINIINYYKTKAAVVLEYYKPAANFYWLKKQVDYHMRYSLLFTLARKHRKSVSKIIGLIGKNASIFIQSTNGKLTKVSSFLVSSEIQNYKRGFTSIFDPMKGFKKLKKPFLKMSIPKVLYKECQAKNCTNNKIEIYYVKAIYHKILRNLKVFPIHFENKKLSGIKAFESYFGRKQIPLCKEHYIDIYSGRFVDLNVKNNLVPLKLWSQKKVEIKW